MLVPSIGLSILGAWALASARGLAALVAAGLAILYCTVSIADLHMTEKYFYNRARPMKYMVLGLEITSPGGDGQCGADRRRR